MIIGAVWLILGIVYGIISLQTHKKEGQLTAGGVSMIRSFADRAGLPLLDQDIKKLRGMLVELGQQPDVLYASVVDHKNKIIAFTDAGKLLPPRKSALTEENGVETWIDSGAMIFSSAIMFSQTPIGEVRLALSREYIVRARQTFVLVAAFSLAGLCVAALGIHGRRLMGWMNQWLRLPESGNEGQASHCRHCGQPVVDGCAVCHAYHDMDRGMIFKLSDIHLGRDDASGIRLTEIGSNPQLASIKGQLIKQCAEIITQLSSSDGCSGRQARENLR